MLDELAAFAVLAAVVTVTPGLDTMLVLRTAAVHGRRAALAAGVGIGLGCLCWAAASAVGIAALLTASRLAYDVLRVAGAGYLCWLGVRLVWRARRPGVDSSRAPTLPPTRAETAPLAEPEARPFRSFRTGLATNLLNPKVGVFYLSALPQFLPDDVPALPGSAALGAVHVAEGLLWFALIAAAVQRAGRWLTRPAVRRRLDQVTGVVFVALGIRLAVEAQRTPG